MFLVCVRNGTGENLGSDSSGGQANLTALTGGRRAVQNQGSTAPSLPLCLAFAAHRLFITSKSPHQASLGSDQVRHPTGKQILASVLQSTGSGLLCLTFSNLLSPGSRNTGLRSSQAVLKGTKLSKPTELKPRHMQSCAHQRGRGLVLRFKRSRRNIQGAWLECSSGDSERPDVSWPFFRLGANSPRSIGQEALPGTCSATRASLQHVTEHSHCNFPEVWTEKLPAFKSSKLLKLQQ